ncbi:MAG TPA: ABC transporter permease [Candidatus Angelobacter sp.]
MMRRKRMLADLDEDILDHIERETQDNIERGMSPEEARNAALRKFGNVARVKEETREVWSVVWLEQLWLDVRYALRMLRKSPGFTVVAVLTLALGIGANTTVFSVIQAVILEPLPYPQSDRLVMVLERVHLRTYENDQNDPSPGNFADWRAQNSVFEDMAAIQDKSFNLTGSGQPLRVEGEAVSPSLFSLLRVHTALGRTFSAEEDVPGGSHVVVMGYGLWTRQFGADPQILQRSILLDGVKYQVIGVMERSFRFPDPANFHGAPADQLWVPIALTPAELSNHGSHYLQGGLARLKVQITLGQAQAEMDGIAQRLTRQHPNTNQGTGVNVVPLQEELVGSVKAELWILFGAVGLVLLIVCANVANLLLVRTSARGRELALRIALGARRMRIVRQLLTESVLLALLGGCAGVLLAYWGIRALPGIRALQTLGLSGLPIVGELGVGTPVLLFSLVISLLGGVIFGIIPAWQVMRSNVQHSLKGNARESHSRSCTGLRDVLVVAELALGVTVVVGAALLLRSFLLLQQTPLGFDPGGLLTFRAIPRSTQYSQPWQRSSFYQQALAKIKGVPAVKSAGAVSFLPLTFYRASKGFSVEGQPALTSGELPLARYEIVSQGYFETLGVPVVQGRDFSWRDSLQSLPVIVINEAMAQTYWPNQDPVGKRIKEGRPDQNIPWITVAGVVEDFRDFDVASQPRPTIFFPVSQASDGTNLLRDWVVRTGGNPLAVAAQVRDAIWSVNKDVPVSRIQPMEEVRSISVAKQQFTLLLLGIFAGLALLLAGVGLYGVTAYAAAQRTREIGIRMALGAQRRDVMLLVLSRGASIGFVGVGIGILAALLLTRLMGALLYGVRATDPLTYSGVALLLTVVTLIACYIPARRAMRTDPMVAVRCE